MKVGEVLFLSKNDVSKYINQQEALELTEKSIEEFALGNTNNPSKLILPCFPYHNGHINSMPSYISETGYAGIKFVGGFSENKTRGMPFITVRRAVRSPYTRPVLPRISSATSGFFFWGIMLEPVE